MARKRAGGGAATAVVHGATGGQPQLNLPDGEKWEDEVPAPVQQAADEYIEALRGCNAAREEMNLAKDACIEAMKEHGCAKLRIDEGKKWLVLEAADKLKTQKVKSDGSADDDE